MAEIVWRFFTLSTNLVQESFFLFFRLEWANAKHIPSQHTSLNSSILQIIVWLCSSINLNLSGLELKLWLRKQCFKASFYTIISLNFSVISRMIQLARKKHVIISNAFSMGTFAVTKFYSAFEGWSQCVAFIIYKPFYNDAGDSFYFPIDLQFFWKCILNEKQFVMI